MACHSDSMGCVTLRVRGLLMGVWGLFCFVVLGGWFFVVIFFFFLEKLGNRREDWKEAKQRGEGSRCW